MDNSKINQSELTYSCSAGVAKVNLYTGRLLFEHNDLNLGTNSYQIGVSHVFNSNLELPCDSYMGKKWKLNVQQFLNKSETYPTVYTYYDSVGHTHKFESLDEKKYYDTSGLGYILEVISSNVCEITNMNGKMVFENGRLVRTITPYTVEKHYKYNSFGQLISIFDSRKKSNMIEFTYDNSSGLLNSATIINNNKVVKSLTYTYNNSNQLLGIIEKVDGIDKVDVLLSYVGDNISYVVSTTDKSALKFEYEHDKVNFVSTGYANLSYKEGEQFANYVGDTLYVNDLAYYGDLYKCFIPEISGGVNLFGINKLNHNLITYNNKKYTIVTNDKNVKILYFFNDLGYTISIFEAHNGDLNDLRVLEKNPGTSMIDVGDEVEKINTRNAYRLTTLSNISTDKDSIMNKRLSKVIDYRNKYTNYINYYCSFWLKLESITESSKIKLKVYYESYNHKSEEGMSSFDNTLIDRWQLISIPIKVSHTDISKIELKFIDELQSNNNIKIADMRLCYSPSTRFCLTDGSKWCGLDEVYEIDYVLNSNSEVKKEIVNESFFMTENDLQATYLSMFMERGLSETGNAFILSLCDGTKKYLVNNVQLIADNGVFPLIFGNDVYTTSGSSVGTRAQFFHEMISPDGDFYTYGTIYFEKNKNINGKCIDCIRQITEANKYIKTAKDHKEGYTELYTDLFGKILFEKNEYGIETVYSYDTYGNEKNKIISHPNSNEEFIIDLVNNDNYSIKNDYNSEVKTKFNENSGYVDTVETNGNGGTSSTRYDINFEYNKLGKLVSVKNNIGDKNYINYDNYGRLVKVSPTGWNDENSYGYLFNYDTMGRTNKYYLLYGKNFDLAQDLLVEKNYNYDEDSITTKYYRGETTYDTIKVVMDIYGRTNSVTENGKTVNLNNRQNLWESQGASEIESLYDPYEDKTYVYNYDEFNNITGYEIKNGNSIDGDNYLSIKASGENKVEYQLNSGLLNKTTFESEIIYDDNKLLEPRVIKSNDPISTLGYPKEIEYSYDDLGRIVSKKQLVAKGIDLFYSEIKEDIKYKSLTLQETSKKRATLLKEKMETVLTNPISDNVEFDYNFTYDTKGNLKTKILKQKRGSNIVEDYANYDYDKANRLIYEYRTHNNAVGNYTSIRYFYNKDGSISQENTGTDVYRKYSYNKGKLENLIEYYGLGSNDFNKTYFKYDNLGNCTHYNLIDENNSANMVWERGKLLKKYFNAGTSHNQLVEYSYNCQGIRYKKKVGNLETTYYLDGGKIIYEIGEKEIKYIYDIEGIYGFKLSNNIYPYRFIKDSIGNVISIVDTDKVVAHYEYDAWGNCIVRDENGNITTDPNHIGNINPIRWKSQYYDNESGFYYINGRYYSPQIRQYINMANIESAKSNAATIYALNLYSLTLENPLNIMYNNYTIATNKKLTYEQPGLNGWQRFWRSKWGKGVAIVLFIAGCVLSAICPAFAPYFVMAVAFTTATLFIGATIAGIKSKRQGKGFLRGFDNYINENWAQSYSISIAITMITFGISQAAQAIAQASEKRQLANALDDGLGTYFPQRGHHPMAKSAFKGMPNYNADDAITISLDKIKEFGTTHATITGQQHHLYSEFAKTGQKLTMETMKQIEIQAMVNAGIPVNYATNAVNQAVMQLNSWGITNPVCIPWG